MSVYDVWLSLAMGTNCANGREIIDLGLSPQELYESRKNLAEHMCFSRKQLENAISVSLEQAQKIYSLHLKNEIQSVNYLQIEYSQRLADIERAPLVLYYKGDISLLKCEKTVGIIGTRHCDREGQLICADISKGLAKAGAVVVSGLAQGLDSEGHKASLEVGGKTIAFVGVPLDKYYPAANRPLQQEIEEKGLVLCEYVMGSPFHNSDFLERNRLIAAQSDALCIVQAQEKSGTLATARLALEYGKALFAVPGGYYNPLFKGTNQLLSMGKARAVSGVGTIMDSLGIKNDVSENSKQKIIADDISQTAKDLYGCFEGPPLSTNQLIQLCGLSALTVKAAITELEMNGYIKAQSFGVYYKL